MVTIGHFCLLHACTIHNKAFFGMNSTIMDHAIIESESMVASGSLVTVGKVIKSGEILAGRTAKFFKKMSDEEIKHIAESSENYITLVMEYKL